MIQVENLHKRFGNLHAVDGISFSVKKGELFGFLGPNGAGKTTSLSMIAGLLKPDEGTVLIDEMDIWQTPLAVKKIIGLVPQEVSLYEELTARENLHFWGSLYSLSRSDLAKSIDTLLDRVGLADRANDPVAKFSGGMKRRLNLAAGLVHQPRLVFLDEPTVGIDPQSRNNILDFIRELAQAGTTIVFTTHHLEEAESLCERIAIMDHGKILATGSVEELAKLVGDGDMISIHGKFSALEFKSVFDNGSVKVISVADNTATCILPQGGWTIAQFMHHLTEAHLEILDLSIQK
ncbi:MAG: ABC transporter ATP-binding protein, partial [bacterium]|nr:ABC transporter ATP-binding protein [bacterium]